MNKDTLRNDLALIYFSLFGKTFGRGYERYKINLIKNKILNKKINIKKNKYFDERIIEIPWIVKELKSKGNLLDVGSTLNFDYIIFNFKFKKNLLQYTLSREK